MIFGHSGLSDFFRGAVVSSSLPESSNVLFPPRGWTRKNASRLCFRGMAGDSRILSFFSNEFHCKKSPERNHELRSGAMLNTNKR